MAILEPGKFKVAEKRKPIPAAVERAVRKRYELDHRPALNARPYDTEAGDFIPPQNDPKFLFLIEDKEHDQRTFGRKPDAEKTVTTRGSDIGEAKRVRNIRKSQVAHQEAMTGKAELDRERPRRTKPGISSRQFPKQHRPLQGQKFQRRP